MKILSSYKNSYAEISDINNYAKKPEIFIARCEKNYYDQIAGCFINKKPRIRERIRGINIHHLSHADSSPPK